MASSKSFLEYILDQLSGLSELRHRAMMGEYILYYKGRIAAYICDDRVLVKLVPAAQALLPDAPREQPYPGAKEMLRVDNVDDRAFLAELFEAMYEDLPELKRKK